MRYSEVDLTPLFPPPSIVPRSPSIPVSHLIPPPDSHRCPVRLMTLLCTPPHIPPTASTSPLPPPTLLSRPRSPITASQPISLLVDYHQRHHRIAPCAHVVLSSMDLFRCTPPWPLPTPVPASHPPPPTPPAPAAVRVLDHDSPLCPTPHPILASLSPLPPLPPQPQSRPVHPFYSLGWTALTGISSLSGTIRPCCYF